MNPALTATRTLKEHRRNVLRITQQRMARRVGCSQAAISCAESGVVPSPYILARFAKAYRLTEPEFVRLVNASKTGGPDNETQSGMSHAPRVSGAGLEVAAGGSCTADGMQTSVDFASGTRAPSAAVESCAVVPSVPTDARGVRATCHGVGSCACASNSTRRKRSVAG